MSTPPETGSDNDIDPANDEVDENLIAVIPGAGEGGDDYVFRRGVLAIAQRLKGDLSISSETRQSLNNWCIHFLWIAEVEKTKSFLKDIGLGAHLDQINPTRA